VFFTLQKTLKGNKVTQASNLHRPIFGLSLPRLHHLLNHFCLAAFQDITLFLLSLQFVVERSTVFSRLLFPSMIAVMPTPTESSPLYLYSTFYITDYFKEADVKKK